MAFNNNDLFQQVLGSIMRRTDLLVDLPTKIVLDDFSKENVVARIVFASVSNLAERGMKDISITSLEGYVQETLDWNMKYIRNNGRDFVRMCLEKADPDNFQVFYNQLKKTSLLRDLKEHGYNIQKYDYEDVRENSKEEFERHEAFDKATEQDILAHVEKSFSNIRARHSQGAPTNCKRADEGIRELLEQFSLTAQVGAPLNGDLYNSVAGGAIRGKLYLRSAATNVGKSRWAVFDACKIVFPMYYDPAIGSFVWEKDKVPQKTLFITTEMKVEELQTIILAYLAGVEEQHIKRNCLTAQEAIRINDAMLILEMYGKYLILEQIENPDLNNVQGTIKRHVLMDDVSVVFYDYIFTSPALLQQFSSTGVREDVILMMMANQLKEIATTYNIFIATSTQINGDGLKLGEKKDQRVLRGSKAIADKADFGCIISQVSPEELEQIQPLVRQFGAPTHACDIYKMRNGIHKGERIWSRMNLGTGYKEDLFITNENGIIVGLEEGEFIPPFKKEKIFIAEDFLQKVRDGAQ